MIQTFNQIQWRIIQPQLKQALNPARSQNFGRRLFQVQLDDQLFWLKLQLKSHSAEHEVALYNEIQCYRHILKQAPELLARFEVIDTTCLGLQEDYLEQGILLGHTDPLFQHSPHSLSQAEIYQCLYLSLDLLKQLHALSWVHGDLKVEHFRKIHDRAVLIDFEQAFSVKFSQNIKHTATPRYMAPELFHAQAKSYASDAYALGIIWLEWLTQEKLQAKSYLDWAKLHCQQLKIELPKRYQVFEAVLSGLLSKEKSHRCTNFYQIKQLLSQNEQRKSTE